MFRLMAPPSAMPSQMGEKDWMVEGQVIRVKRGRIWEANSCGVIEMSSGASVWAVSP